MTKNTGDAPKTGLVNVALYVRVSTDKQANKEDGSLDTQLDRLTSFVDYRCKQGENWVVTEKLVEGERDGKRRGKSAKNTDRASLKRLLDLARARMIDVVVVTKIDRISRSTVDFLILVKQLESYGVKLVSLRENIDLTTPSGKFQTTLLIALAEHERETISVRTKEKVEWRAEKGLPIGPPPIGYAMREKAYVIDEQYAKHVRACDRLYLEHESSQAVLHELNRLGYRTPRGHHYSMPLICRMLRNPTYAAKIHYEGNVYDAQWKPLRSPETHERIQKLMDTNNRRRRSSKRSMEYPYYLQGLLRCAVCEHVMSPKPGTGRNGRYYSYYACTNAEKSLGAACARRYVSAEVVDRAVLDYLKKLQLDPQLVRRFVARANEKASETLGRLREDLARVQESLATVRSQLSNMADAVARGGGAAMATLAAKMEALETERADLEKSEARLKAEIEAESCQVISAEEQLRTLSLFKDFCELNSATPDRIKSILPHFVDHVVWREEKGAGTLEVELFPTPFVRPEDGKFKEMVAELSDACGSGRLSVRPGVTYGVPDGI